MGFVKQWRRWKGFLKWREMDTPMLLNEQTGELRKFTALAEKLEGDWLLRRPLTLPESSKPLFVTIRLSSEK